MPAGRPSKLAIDPELQGRIMAMVRVGMFPDRAAVAAGIGERTHYLWQQKGYQEREQREAGKVPRKTWQVYLDYVDELDQAVAEAEFLLVGKITKGGTDGPDLRWILERRFRDRWSTKATGPAATQPAAAGPGQKASAVDQVAAKREQRRVKKA